MGSVKDRRLLERMRSQTDASLIGAGTLRQSNPEIRCLDGALPENRIRAILTNSGDIPVAGKKIFAHGPQPYIFTSNEKKKIIEGKLSGQATIIGVTKQNGQLNVQEVILELKKMGVKALLVEGGAALNYSCLSQDIVDEMYITITPYISGDSSLVSLVEGPKALGNPFKGLELIECEKSDTTDELFLHYKVKNRHKNG